MKFLSRKYSKRLALSLGLLSIPLSVHLGIAETLDFGGYPDRFKGKGDQEPPRCVFDAPKASDTAFFVQWNCTDDVSTDDELRSELWLYRKNATHAVKLADFLGFPASVQINEGILQTETMTEGLPIQLRLIVRDRAGVAAITPLVPVLARDTEVETCDLEVITDATQSTGTTTGTPSERVFVDNQAVLTQELSESSFRILTSRASEAEPCEIEAICADDNEVRFDSTLEVAEDGSVSGTVLVNPGSTISSVTGSIDTEGSVLNSLEVTGRTFIDGIGTTVKVSCAR